jgi:hypothetical protein
MVINWAKALTESPFNPEPLLMALDRSDLAAVLAALLAARTIMIRRQRDEEA